MSSRERNMLIGLGVVAVAALAFFLLTSGDEEPVEETAPTSVTSSPAVTPSPQAQEEEEEEEEATDPAFDFLGGRDPFVPLVSETESGEAPTDDTTTGGETTTGDTTTGDTTTGDTTTGETTTGDTTTGDTTSGESTSGGTGGTGSEGGTAEVTLTGRPVTLVSISSRRNKDLAQVEVDGQTFTVSEGQRFSQRYQLVSITRQCARFLFGDESFSLCEEVPPR